MLSILLEENVEFVLVGAYAMAMHGFPRATGDIGIFVKPSEANAKRIMSCLSRFGTPLHNVSAEDFSIPGRIF